MSQSRRTTRRISIPGMVLAVAGVALLMLSGSGNRADAEVPTIAPATVSPFTARRRRVHRARTVAASRPTSEATAEPTDDHPGRAEEGEDAPPAESRSVGFVGRGTLLGGVRLRESATVRHVPRFAAEDRFWGTAGLVGLLERTAARVAARAPGSPMNVGELSQRGGGDVVGHRSHESGRDVDVGFYLVDANDGTPVSPARFVRIGRTLRGGIEGRPVRFDSPRNWALVESLVTDEETPVMMIFVAPHIRMHLLRYAQREGVPAEIIDRAGRVLIRPEGVARHDDHFHVRVYCAPRDGDGCRDRGPYWQWIPDSFVPADAPRLPRYWPHGR